MRLQTAIACFAVLLGCAASSSAQAVSLQFNNGLVTLNAQNAPIRTILAEWSRLGGTRFVNADRIGGQPVTLELTALPERQALEILLRTVAGYVATQREGTGGVSQLGGVVILPTSAPVRAPAPVTFGATTVQQQPQRAFMDVQNDQDDRQGQPLPPSVTPFNTPATTNTPGAIRVVTPGVIAPFGSVTDPQQTGAPQPARPPSTIQTLPGTSRPGEITPQPQQPQPQQQSPQQQR